MQTKNTSSCSPDDQGNVKIIMIIHLNFFHFKSKVNQVTCTYVFQALQFTTSFFQRENYDKSYMLPDLACTVQNNRYMMKYLL